MTMGTIKSIVRYAGIALISVAVFFMTIWVALALYYSNLPGEYLRIGLAGIFVLATAAAFLFLPKRSRTLTGFVALLCGNCHLVDDHSRLEYTKLGAGSSPRALYHDGA